MNGRDEMLVWRMRRAELVRDARDRRLARALRAKDRARRVERRLGDRAPAGGSERLAKDRPHGGDGHPSEDRRTPGSGGGYGPWNLWGRTLVPFFGVGSRPQARERQGSREDLRRR